MLHLADHYLQLSEQALSSAESAASLDERIRQLEMAYQFAKLASDERKGTNVYKFGDPTR